MALSVLLLDLGAIAQLSASAVECAGVGARAADIGGVVSCRRRPILEHCEVSL